MNAIFKREGLPWVTKGGRKILTPPPHRRMLKITEIRISSPSLQPGIFDEEKHFKSKNEIFTLFPLLIYFFFDPA